MTNFVKYDKEKLSSIIKIGNEHANGTVSVNIVKSGILLKKKVSSIKAKSQTEFGNYFKKENIPLRMSEIDSESEIRLVVKDDEWNNVLGVLSLARLV